jgi:hypothetical protein
MQPSQGPGRAPCEWGEGGRGQGGAGLARAVGGPGSSAGPAGLSHKVRTRRPQKEGYRPCTECLKMLAKHG